MRKIALVPVAVLTLGLALAGCSSTPAALPSSPDKMASSSSMPSSSPMSSDMQKTGTFMGLNGKNVKGTVTISGSDLKLTGFSSDEGPDLHVYLTTGTDEAAVSAGKEISTVVFNQDTQSFMLSGVDASMYTDVVIHCDKAKAVFGAAPLS
ncbi:DM13 domain-containing protein [Microbacterium panaciterrae]|uniref:DM13 domain-containing protein n=1 Tax=Microbacterium panaciterrae TaxID=985759 RepID=A0ABP8P1P9_9MICO